VTAVVSIIFFFAVQIISLAGWVNIMYYVQDAHSFWDWIYFATLIVVSCRGVDPARLDNDVSVAA